MVIMASSEVYRIGPITYDSSTRTLTHDNGQTEYFTPRVNDVFLLLLEHQGTCVEKEFLLSQCWGEAIVSEQALTNVISKLRKVLVKHALTVITITTVSKSGYLLEVKMDDSCVVGADNKQVKQQLERKTIKPSLLSEDIVKVNESDIKKPVEPNILGRKSVFYLLIILISITTLLIYYINDVINATPYFIDAKNYSHEINIGTNKVYFNEADDYDVDKALFIKDITKGISSVCHSNIYAQFYYNTRIANNSAIVVFIMIPDGRTFNFRMSKYNYRDFSKQLNSYLESKNISC
ncbi:winged helix-turn-helix domain-containing protein [Photobacterium leiognathi]|uniref:Transcriptional regulatory, C terminal family protein n=4 Tax=Photobacterium leiognathi TaxID=553611 RepID=X0P7Q2_PHOLE|nr:winged helix-turn-helix domain-containing protein [Photobacterium leiognathi]PSV89187.1 transcriptional regulator [Photobacterium leiognathi]GAD28943.1 transcriptional regulatory, C terminal family protein [Photobacterium leiognathi lrivu.4.1]